MDCRIREWRVTDAEAVATALNNKRVLDHLRDGYPSPYTIEDAKEFIQSMLTANPTTTFCFAITWKDKAIGSIGAFRQSNIHARTAEMGYYLAEPYWGKGYMTSAVKQLCDYVFANSDIVRIYAEPFATNVGSCRVLEKAGFTYEGTLRSNARKNGVTLDMKMYSLLRTDKSRG